GGLHRAHEPLQQPRGRSSDSAGQDQPWHSLFPLERVSQSACDFSVQLLPPRGISRWPRRAAAAPESLGVCQLEICEGVGARARLTPLARALFELVNRRRLELIGTP